MENARASIYRKLRPPRHHDFQGKILLVGSELDELVPYQTTKNYLESVKASVEVKFILMKAIGHALMNPIKLYQYRFMKFQSEWLSSNI